MLYSKTLNLALRGEAWIVRRQKGIPNPVTSYIHEVETGYLRTPGKTYSKKTAIAIGDR